MVSNSVVYPVKLVVLLVLTATVAQPAVSDTINKKIIHSAIRYVEMVKDLS
jgi:hypothetical protein